MRKVVGCMTGTSMDGLDICLTEIIGSGLEMKVKILQHGSFNIDQFKERFSRLSQTLEVNLPDYLKLAAEFGAYHGECIQKILKGTNIDLVCAHGQTLYHKPPLSLQLINPFTLASRVKAPTVYDLRGMDLACGGEGAPITPIADQILYQIKSQTAIINFGGFSNYTLISPKLSKGRVQGGDICACNLLLNQLCMHFFKLPFDRDGKIALSGKLNLTLFARIVDILKKQSSRKKSLGTNDDDFQEIIQNSIKIPPEDVLRTACCAVAEVISLAVNKVETIILAGGGAKNKCLITELQYKVEGNVKTSEECSVPSEIREAACFAILGALCQDRVSIIIPEITGGNHGLISGAWVYP